jgi:hypothetical protein
MLFFPVFAATHLRSASSPAFGPSVLFTPSPKGSLEGPSNHLLSLQQLSRVTEEQPQPLYFHRHPWVYPLSALFARSFALSFRATFAESRRCALFQRNTRDIRPKSESPAKLLLPPNQGEERKKREEAGFRVGAMYCAPTRAHARRRDRKGGWPKEGKEESTIKVKTPTCKTPARGAPNFVLRVSVRAARPLP